MVCGSVAFLVCVLAVLLPWDLVVVGYGFSKRTNQRIDV